MAHLYRHKVHGWRVEYELVYKDQTTRLRTKYAKEESKAKEILKTATLLEALIRDHQLTLSEIAVYQEQRFLDKGDKLKLLADESLDDNDMEIIKLVQRVNKKDKEAVLTLLRSLSRHP